MAEQDVPFETMGQPDFDRVVEALLVEEHTGGGFRAQALDGRGGDGGVDVGVWDTNNRIVRIFQLKYFPEGFSGMFSKRRQQVKDSFDSAWSNHRPPRWTLVIPRNASREEQEFLLRLRDDCDVQVDIVGRAELDNLLGKHSHLLERFATDRTLQYLKAINRPEEALAHRKDVPVVLDRMRNRMQAQSAHWTWAFGTDGHGNNYQHLVARHPNAHIAEPLTSTLTATFSKDSEDLRLRFDRAMRFGVAETIVLPGSVVTSLVHSGAPWFEGEDEVAELHLIPVDNGAGRAVTLIAEDAGGRRLGSIRGTVKRFAQGPEGGQLVVDVIGGLTARWVIPRSVNAPPQDVTFETSNTGVPVRDVRLLTKFMSRIDDAHRVIIRLDGNDFAAFNLGGGDRHAPDPAFLAFLDDLVTIENELDVQFIFPADGVSKQDRLWAATIKQILLGSAVPIPGVDGYNMTLDGGYDDFLLNRLRGEGMSMLAQRTDFSVELLGEEVHLGHVYIHQREAHFENGDAHADALEQGKGKGRVAHAVSVTNLPWMIYQPERLGSDGEPVPLSGWGVPGLPEHPGLAALKARQLDEHPLPGEEQRRGA